MAYQEKLILQLLCKYAEMVNAQFNDLDHRLQIAEMTLAEHPDVFQTYQHTLRAMPKREFPPGLPRQLEAVKQAVDRLPD